MIGAPSVWPLVAVSLAAASLSCIILLHFSWAPLMQRIIEGCVQGLSAIFDPDLSDREKERTVQTAGGSVLIAAMGMGWRAGLAILGAALPIVLADRIDWVGAREVIAFLMSVEFIFGATLLAVCSHLALRKLRPQRDHAPPDGNSAADQLVHTFAFAAPWIMKTSASIDDFMIGRGRINAHDPRPIFVTSLARAGTTSVLNALHSCPNVAAHQYRDMPFITAPWTWAKLSRGRTVARRPRAHGDGMLIDLDSPEAFDEVLWKLHWPEKYEPRAIRLWSEADHDPRKVDRLARNFAKIVALRSADDAPRQDRRYMSKNNANIARLSMLDTAFPGAQIVVPLRRPGPHAKSLHCQHLNFLKLHAEAPFTKRYMRDLGHFEFGALHRSIDFPAQAENPFDPSEENYWLYYWVAAFRQVRRHRHKCIFLLQDSLRADPEQTMARLIDRLALKAPRQGFQSFFKSGEDVCDTSAFAPKWLSAAEDLYQDLARDAIYAMPAETRYRAPR